MMKALGDFFANLPLELEFWSAVVGAVIGGAIALIAQWYAVRVERQHREEDRAEVRRALGYSLLFKMLKIHSDVVDVCRYLRERFDGAKKEGFLGEAWQIVVPMANPPGPIDFSSDEMAMLLSLKVDDVTNAIMNEDRTHNSLLAAVVVLGVERSRLETMLPVHVAGAASLESFLDAKTSLALRPQMMRVNSLVEGIWNDANAAKASSRASLENLHKALATKVGITQKLSFPYDEEDKSPSK